VKALRAWVSLGLAATLVACSGDDHPALIGGARAVALPECPGLDYSTCDARDARCQKRLLSIAGCVYGVDSTPSVPVRIVTEAQLIDELTSAPSDDGSDDADDLRHIERAFVDLGLMQPGDLTADGGSTTQIIGSVDGVYQDAERGIALVDRGVPKNTVEEDAVLVHEMVHAIQDAEYGLADWRAQYPSDVDTALALRTVTEGQATYAQFRVILAMSGRDVDRVDWNGTLNDFRQELLDSALEDPSPYLASITTFPYAVGTWLARQGWDERGLLYHQAQFAEPPLSTLQVLNLNYGRSPDAPEPIELVTPTPDADSMAVDETVLGAFMLRLSSHQLGAALEDASALAFSWRGDKLWIYADPDAQTAWLWELELDDETQTSALAALAEGGGLVTKSSATRLFIAGGDHPPAFLLDAGEAFLAAVP
jgi:hypothetical protein